MNLLSKFLYLEAAGLELRINSWTIDVEVDHGIGHEGQLTMFSEGRIPVLYQIYKFTVKSDREADTFV
jgi:hypothetical protein